MLCKKTEFKLKKLDKRVQLLTKTMFNCTFNFMQFPKKMIFRKKMMRMYCTPARAHLLRQHTFATYYQQILLKSPGLSVVSDPRNALRHKQGRLTL